MRVLVLKSFVAVIASPRMSRERKVRGVAGEIINMPPGEDWIKAGLVIPAPGEKYNAPPLPIGNVDFVEEDDEEDEDRPFEFKPVQHIEEAIINVPEKAVTRLPGKSPAKKKAVSRKPKAKA